MRWKLIAGPEKKPNLWSWRWHANILHEGAYTVFMAFTWSPDIVWLYCTRHGGSWSFSAC